MKVGIKYCGGCNPRYERRDFVEKLTREAGEGFVFQGVEEGEDYDYLLLIGGCTNCCPDYSDIQVTQGLFRIKSEKDYKDVLKFIKNKDCKN